MLFILLFPIIFIQVFYLGKFLTVCLKRALTLNQSGEVIFLTSEFPPICGGIGSQAFNIYKELSKNNYTISIIAPFAKSELEKG